MSKAIIIRMYPNAVLVIKSSKRGVVSNSTVATLSRLERMFGMYVAHIENTNATKATATIGGCAVWLIGLRMAQSNQSIF